MANNIYRYRESIWFGSKPSDYWGWLMSTSTEMAGNTWFSSEAKQDRFIKIVKKHLTLFEKKRGVKVENPSGVWGEWQAFWMACQIRGPGEGSLWIEEILAEGLSEDLRDFLGDIADSAKDLQALM